MIFEFYPPEMANIQLSCQATSAYIHKQVQKDFTDYSKLLVQINNNSKNTPDYIYLTMHGTSTAPANAHLIVYGTKDWSDSISPLLYDHTLTDEMFEYDDGDIKMNTDLDMNNHYIHISNGSDDTDAVNKRQLDTVSTAVDTVNNRLNTLDYYIKSYAYRQTFGYGYYDLVETSRFNISKLSYGVVIQGIKPSLFFREARLLSNYDRITYKSHINLENNINQNTSYTIFISLYLANYFVLFFSNTPTSGTFYPVYDIINNNLRIKESSSVIYTSPVIT